MALTGPYFRREPDRNRERPSIALSDSLAIDGVIKSKSPLGITSFTVAFITREIQSRLASIGPLINPRLDGIEDGNYKGDVQASHLWR